jgi:hypothetical protein
MRGSAPHAFHGRRNNQLIDALNSNKFHKIIYVIESFLTPMQLFAHFAKTSLAPLIVPDCIV